MISIDEINKLKAENERLKREYDILDGIIDTNNAKIGQVETLYKVATDRCNDLLAEVVKDIPFEGLIEYGGLTPLEVLRGIKAQNKKYKTCLQEIKEIAKRGFAVCDDDCGNAIRYTQILQKISEVE